MMGWRYKVHIERALGSFSPFELEVKTVGRRYAAAIRDIKPYLTRDQADLFESHAKSISRAETIKAINRSLRYLYENAEYEGIWPRGEPGPRDWQPQLLDVPAELSGARDASFQSKDPYNMSFDELNEEYIRHWRSKHNELRKDEAYDFDIKVQKVRIPGKVRGVYSEEEIQAKYNERTQFAIQDFVDWLKDEYDWIEEINQEGRSGGWLVLYPNSYAFVEGIPLVAPRRRLKSLRFIYRQLKAAKEKFVRGLEDVEFWEISPRDWSPRWKKE